tara:strand:- start:8145 stop:8507 length:363 start_codon:yes stop_codon:yes gene_type:complete
MNFYINKGATLPLLKMELINDGRNDYNNFHDKVQNSVITFCMTDTSTGIKRIGGKEGLCFLKEPDSNCTGEEYYIGYQFSTKETRKAGTYVGEFTITFNDGSGTLIVPIRDELFIHILEN